MLTKIAVATINFYQSYLSFDTGVLRVLAPGGACRHEIRCSEHAKQMIISRGLLTGSFLGFRRILSCR